MPTPEKWQAAPGTHDKHQGSHYWLYLTRSPWNHNSSVGIFPVSQQRLHLVLYQIYFYSWTKLHLHTKKTLKPHQDPECHPIINWKGGHCGVTYFIFIKVWRMSGRRTEPSSPPWAEVNVWMVYSTSRVHKTLLRLLKKLHFLFAFFPLSLILVEFRFPVRAQLALTIKYFSAICAAILKSWGRSATIKPQSWHNQFAEADTNLSSKLAEKCKVSEETFWFRKKKRKPPTKYPNKTQ